MAMYLSTVFADNPSNYFRLGDLTGTLARDEVVNRYIGQIHNGVTLGQASAIPNYTDGSMLFDGSSGYIDLTSAVPQSPVISVECWFNLSNVAFSGYPRPLANDNVGSSNKGVELGIIQFGGGVFVNFGFTSSNVDVGYGIPLFPGVWYYLAAVYDGATAYLYLNDSLVGSSLQNHTLAAGTYAFNIGRNPAYAGDYFPGLIDELAIYNGVALNASQIAAHYQAGIQNQPEQFTVLVSGDPVFVEQGTLQCQKSIGTGGSASFTAQTDSNTHFRDGQQTVVFDQLGSLAFTGYIHAPSEDENGYNTPDGWQGTLTQSISCDDQTWLAKKRTVAATFTNKTVGYIAQWLLDNILSQEGVVRGQIYDGLTPSPYLYPSPTLYPGGNIGIIPQITFNYCRVSEALDAIVQAASNAGIPYYWLIDMYKRLWVVPYNTVVSSNIVDGSFQENIKVKRANPKFRSQQIVLGGVTQTVQQVETRKGDNSTTVFSMTYDLAMVPTITVNGVAKTVGINGVDSSQDWFWNKGSKDITQKSGATKLISTDTLSVTYIGQYPNAAISQNAAQVSARAAIDGTSGIVEDVINNDSLNDANSALQTASANLTLYGQDGLQLTFDTMESDFAPGQLVSVNMPWHEINDNFLIESVSAGDNKDNYNIWYSVQAVLGPYDIFWEDYYTKLHATPAIANNINVGTTQSVNILQPFTCSVTDAGVLTTSVCACPIMGSSTIMSATLIMC